jgi:hypothetical protein
MGRITETGHIPVEKHHRSEILTLGCCKFFIKTEIFAASNAVFVIGIRLDLP